MNIDNIIYTALNLGFDGLHLKYVWQQDLQLFLFWTESYGINLWVVINEVNQGGLISPDINRPKPWCTTLEKLDIKWVKHFFMCKISYEEDIYIKGQV